MRSVPEPVGDHSSAPLSGLPGALRDDLHALSRLTFITAKTDRKCLSTEKTLPVARNPNDLNLIGIDQLAAMGNRLLGGTREGGNGLPGPGLDAPSLGRFGGEECKEERRTAA
ncbi:unnamed protein product [Boreogadus saida]